MTVVFISTGKRHVQGEHHVVTDSEIVVMQLQDKEQPEARERQRKILPSLRGTEPANTLISNF